MGIKKIVKKGFSMGFQPKRWIGVEHVKSNGKICADLVTDLFADKKKSAEKNQIEHQLSNDELQSRKKVALLLMFFYSLVSVTLLAYVAYLWFFKSLLLSGCMALIIAMLVSVYSLREFMVFGQIKFKRQRLSLKELLTLLFNQ